MFFKMGDSYQYVKFSIQYMPRCDENGLCHPEEGIKYYVLHKLSMNDLNEIFEIPKPSDDGFRFNDKACLLNDYGRFRFVFDDELTAKRVVPHELLQMIYPYQFILDDEELLDWQEFLDSSR